MRDEAGYTLVELVVAAAVMLTVTSGIFVVIGKGLGSSALWSESADLHQRARVAAETFTSEIGAAGAGTENGPLIRFLPAVEPRRRGSVATGTAITIRYVPGYGPASTLSADLSPATSSAALVVHPGCRAECPELAALPDLESRLTENSDGLWPPLDAELA